MPVKLKALVLLVLAGLGGQGVGLARAADAPPPLQVRFAAEKDYGPFIFVDASGSVKGLSLDILKAIAPASNLAVEILPARNLGEILELAKRGEVDLISSLRPTPERAAYLAFSRPYVSVPAVLVMRRGAPLRSSLGEMAGRRVAVGKGYAVEGFVRLTYPQVSWQAFSDDAAALRALTAGEVDGAVADIASIAFVVHELKLDGLQIHAPVGFEIALSFAYPKDRADIGEALENGLRKLSTDERGQMIRRWVEADALQFKDRQFGAIAIVAGVAGLAALLLVMVALLRRQRQGPRP